MYFGDINRGKGAEEGLGIIIFSQLAKAAHNCKNTDESKEPQVVSKIADGFKIPSNCPSVRVPVLNEVVAVWCRLKKPSNVQIVVKDNSSTPRLNKRPYSRGDRTYGNSDSRGSSLSFLNSWKNTKGGQAIKILRRSLTNIRIVATM